MIVAVRERIVGGTSAFAHELYGAVRDGASKVYYSVKQEVPKALSLFQNASQTFSVSGCASCGNPVCTASFFAAAIIPIVMTVRTVIEKAGSSFKF